MSQHKDLHDKCVELCSRVVSNDTSGTSPPKGLSYQKCYKLCGDMLHKLTQQMKLYNSTQAHTITPGTSAHHWMKEAIDRQASDLFLSTAEPPTLKVYNEFITLKDTPLSAQEILQIITEILPEKKLAEFHSGVDIDLGVDAEGLSRFRINVFRELHGDSLTLRPLPYRIPALNELGLPQVLTKLSHLNSGLILVTGPTGCGKSTTLAAMIEAVNQRAQKHIITIEDPIEYIIPSKRAIIHQREIGTHVASFADGLRSALRENPDIIVVGELRDLESISLAVTAAETGHLVLGTLHSGNAVQAITRLTDAFDSERQPQIRIQLSQSLQAVISQRLFKRRDKPGMAVATEVMIATLAMRTLIRENRIQEMHGYISTGAHEQMHTLEQSVEKMVNEGILDRQCLDELSENVIHAITDPQTNDGKTERGRYAPHKD